MTSNLICSKTQQLKCCCSWLTSRQLYHGFASRRGCSITNESTGSACLVTNIKALLIFIKNKQQTNSVKSINGQIWDLLTTNGLITMPTTLVNLELNKSVYIVLRIKFDFKIVTVLNECAGVRGEDNTGGQRGSLHCTCRLLECTFTLCCLLLSFQFWSSSLIKHL